MSFYSMPKTVTILGKTYLLFAGPHRAVHGVNCSTGNRERKRFFVAHE